MRPHELAERALAAAAGFDDCVAMVNVASRADLRWARTTLTTNGEAAETTLTLLGFRAGRSGVATATLSRGSASSDDVLALVDRLEDALADAPAADDAAPLLANRTSVDQDWAEPARSTDSSIFADMTASLGEAFARAISDDIELFGYAEHSTDSLWMASSTGIRLRHDQPQGRLELTAKSHGRSRSAWWGCATDDFSDVDLHAADQSLRRSLHWQANHVVVEPGRHRALLSPGAVGDLMVDLWWQASARDAVEGRSVFSRAGGGTRLGERLSPQELRLSSDAADPVLACRDFLAASTSSDHASVFDNGAPLDPVDWISEGILRNLMACRSYAARERLPFVASADNIRLEVRGASGGLPDLVAGMNEGVVITCLWYNRVVDPQTMLLTGLTRDGVFVVRGGEIIGSTTNFRFNDSPVAMLGRLDVAGETARTLPREMGDYAPRVAMPPAVFADFHLSTVSDAL